MSGLAELFRYFEDMFHDTSVSVECRYNTIFIYIVNDHYEVIYDTHNDNFTVLSPKILANYRNYVTTIKYIMALFARKMAVIRKN